MTLLEDVKRRLDIEVIVSGYVALTPSGANFRARCPFHAEKTPSFFVFSERQTWRCFGACADGGDAISFVMRIEGIGFIEALRLLANRAGIDTSMHHDSNEVAAIYRINKLTADFFHGHLLNSNEGNSALDYLAQRGITTETISSFQIGLSPTRSGALSGYLFEQGVRGDLPVQSGVVSRNRDGNTRDLFQGRLMFPIQDVDGRIVGFGGRSLDGRDPKYLNTPRTKVFNKSSILYALNFAAEHISNEQVGVIVEGYMDALMAHQSGFKNVVASMGTAITKEQSQQLIRLATRFVLALDPDVAGQEATLRSLEGSWQAFQPPSLQRDPSSRRFVDSSQQVAWLSVAVLPQGEDPHELIRKDPSAWERAVGQPLGLVEFLFDVLPGRYDMATTEGKLAFLERIVGLILSTGDHARQDGYMERLETMFGVNRRTLEEIIGVNRRQLLAKQKGIDFRASRGDVNVPQMALMGNDPLEEYTLALLFQDDLLLEKNNDLQLEFFQRSENREVFRIWMDCGTIGKLMDKVEGTLLESVQALCDRELPPMDSKERTDAFHQCARRLEERYLRELKSHEGFLQSQTGVSQEDSEEILCQLRQRNARLRGLFASKTRGT